MRALAHIYSHRVPGFWETLIGFDPKTEKESGSRKETKRVCRSTGPGQPLSSADRPGRPGPIESSYPSVCRLGGRPLLCHGRPGHVCARRAHRSTGWSTGLCPGLLHTPFLLPLTFSLCAIFLYLLSLSLSTYLWLLQHFLISPEPFE